MAPRIASVCSSRHEALSLSEGRNNGHTHLLEPPSNPIAPCRRDVGDPGWVSLLMLASPESPQGTPNFQPSA